MAAVTVKDVLKLALPTGTTVVAGEGGLGREVKWARTFRTRAPALDFLDGGELALLNVSSVSRIGDDLALPEVVERLTDGGVAALAVVGDICPEAMARADSLGTPLLSLPPGAVLNEVERLVVGLILNREAELQERGVQIYRQLAQLSIEDKGIAAIVEALSRITGKAVAIQDEKLKLQHIAVSYLAIPPGEMEEALHDDGAFASWLAGTSLNSTSPPIALFDLRRGGLSRYVAPIIVKGVVGGYLSVFGYSEDLDELDRVATGRAASVSAIEISKQRAIVEAESRVLGDFIDDLLAGNFGSEQALVARARVLGYDMSIPYAVLVLGLDVTGGGKPGPGSRDTQKLRRDFIAHVSDAVVRQQSQSLLSAREDTITVLLPAERGGDQTLIKRTAEQVRRQVAARFEGDTVSVGVGRFYPQIRDLQKGYREAQQALAIGQKLFGGNRTVHFDELGIYRLLVPLHGSPELVAFFDETLASLVEYDRQHEAQLVKTLETFFSCHGNLSKTAESLYLHRNTLIYRMDRIAEITGLDLDSPEDRLSLQVALKIKEIQFGPR